MSKIVLVGFMGSGKTTIGAALAKQYTRSWVDLDAYIVKQAGMSISDLFKCKGEAYFRALETECLKEVLESYDIISTGGGIVTSEVNRNYLVKEQTIYLAYEFETLYNRIKEDETRPLVTSREALYERYCSRLEAYEAVSQYQLSCEGKSVETLVKEIMALTQIK